MAVKPVYDAFASRPKDQIIRDQFSIATWLSIGAVIQAAAYTLLPYRNIVTILPVVLFLAYKISYTACVATGLLANSRMKDVIRYRTGIIYPDEKGVQDKAANTEMCAIILGVVSNHPLGMLGPGFRGVGDRFDAMVKQMSNDATKYGYLGHSAWLNASDNTTSNEFMTILYFQNEHYLHGYAHGPMHTQTMQWWREVEKEIPHVGIMHEVFACPKKSWEGIYVNYPPVGLGATTKEVIGPDGKKSWVTPLVKLGGKLMYSKERMGRAYCDDEWNASAATMPAETD
ncbi:uncharacterized protein M421DRAFT_100706 [Didymella exigua CBS 183.55]|uniref:Uncharacterized protein n=1 Tax=Didymella exigua CBS 183.55 TaxID=1150837 RepID=A0A6A5RMG8_9PLEO|nr:uncharacterized protein M421DRAFT_100706 [Didymella exigua CBS 183.55]KAF1928982.1 hypothetical protein M421DRAFT_100706 [Didymella exigua CBS 183.55]